MSVTSLRRGLTIDGRTIARTMPGVQYGLRIVTVYFTDGSSATYEVGTSVPAVGYREPFPAGPVRNGGQRFGQTARKVRVSDDHWEGERTGTRHDRIVATMASWDM